MSYEELKARLTACINKRYDGTADENENHIAENVENTETATAFCEIALALGFVF